MWLLISFIAFASSVILHALIVRIFCRFNRVVSFFAVSAMVGCVMLSIVSLWDGFSSSQFLATAATYAFACELYVFLFTLALSSISANILARLHTRRMTIAEIEALYDSRRMVKNRIKRLIESGFVTSGPSRIAISDRGELLLRALSKLRLFFGHDLHR